MHQCWVSDEHQVSYLTTTTPSTKVTRANVSLIRGRGHTPHHALGAKAGQGGPRRAKQPTCYLWVTFGWKAEATWPPWELTISQIETKLTRLKGASLIGLNKVVNKSHRILQGAFTPVLRECILPFHIEISVSNPRGWALFCFSDFFVLLNMCMSKSSYGWAFSTLSHNLLLPLITSV